MNVSADSLLGYRLASASPAEQQQALANRPADLAQLRRIATLVERVFSIIDFHLHLPNPNQLALARIVPPPTIRSQRRITGVRLRRMQQELAPETYPIIRAHKQSISGGSNERHYRATRRRAVEAAQQ